MNRFYVLVADDDADDYEMIRQAFPARNDYRFVHVRDGAQLLIYLHETLSSLASLPDVLLLDINMPKVDGVQALRAIRCEEKYTRVPVIMYSTARDQKQIDVCRELGADGFVSKSCTLEQLVALAANIDNYLRTGGQIPGREFRQISRINTL